MLKLSFYFVMGIAILLNLAGAAANVMSTSDAAVVRQTPTPTMTPTVPPTATPIPTPCFPDDPQKPCPSPSPTEQPLPTTSPTLQG